MFTNVDYAKIGKTLIFGIQMIIRIIQKRVKILALVMMTTIMAACEPVAIGLVAVSAVDLLLDRRPIGQTFDDNTLELKLRKDYTINGVYDGSNISVTALNGIILLTGEVKSEAVRKTAEKEARSYIGVREVVNELAISGKTGFVSRTNDSWITSKVKTNLLTTEGIRASNIKVVTERGKVYLLGLVTREEGERAIDVARKVRGVTHIVKVFEYDQI